MMLNNITLPALLDSCWTFKEPTPSYCGTIAVNSNCLDGSFPISWNTDTEWNNQLLVCTFGSPINGSCLSYDAQTELPVITVPEFPGLFETTGNCILSSGSPCDSHCENYIPLTKSIDLYDLVNGLLENLNRTSLNLFGAPCAT